MDWKGERRSRNLDDRRNSPLAASAGGAALLLRFLPYLLTTKIGRMILVIGVLVYVAARLLGIDVMQIMSGAPAVSQQALSAKDQELTDFVAVVLASTEDAWTAEFKKMGKAYEEPILTLFKNRVSSACGLAQSATGPFYCPADNKLYIDLGFYEEMKTKLGAPGDFAQAYVIAHEVGHHVQNLLGILSTVHNKQRALPASQANALSVKLELQADCFAGIWGHYANTQRKILDAGDIDEALNAAAAIGDDRLQSKASGTIQPEKFTHGTSKQRAEWFNRGFETGAVEKCNTFL